MEQLVEPAQHVAQVGLKREPAAERRQRRPHAHAHVERLRPAQPAAVALCDRAELILEARADAVRHVAEQPAHRVGHGGVGGRAGIEDEGAVVRDAVAIDVALDHGRERLAGRDAAGRGDLEPVGERIRQVQVHGMAPVVVRRAPLAHVRVVGGRG